MARPNNPQKPERFLTLPKIQEDNPELSGQPIPFWVEPKGIDRYREATRVSVEHATRIRNLMLDDGNYISRRGTNILGGEAASEVVQVAEFVRASGKKVTIRFCTRHIELFNYASGAWRSFAIPFTGTAKHFFAWTGWADKLLFSNGIDGLWEFDFKTLTPLLVEGAPSAKHLTTFGNRVVASAVSTGGEFLPLRVQWSVKNNYKDWTGIGSGYEDFFGSPGGATDEVMGVFPYSDEVAWVVRDRSIWQMSVSGNVQAPFRPSRIVYGIGCPFRYAITEVMGGIVFPSRDNIHFLSIEGPRSIGDLIIDEILDNFDTLRGAYAAYDVSRNEYRIALEDTVYRYRFPEQGWTADEYPFHIRSMARQIEGKAGIPIDSLPGIIDSLEGPIDDLVVLRDNDNAMMFVSVTQPVVIREADTTTDVLPTGELTESPFEICSGVVQFDPLHGIELHDISAEYLSGADQTIDFSFSTDDGNDWFPLSSKVIEPTEGSEIMFVKKEINARKVQLRISSLTLGAFKLLGMAPTIVKVTRAMATKKPKVASIEVLPNPLTMAVGGIQLLQVVLKDAAGRVISGRTVQLFSSNASVATVNNNKLVRALSAGNFSIVVSSGTIVANIQGSVAAATQAAVASITVEPATSEGAVGTSQQFTATLRDAGGNVLVGREITWGSSDETVATVDDSGVVTLVAVGSVAISATSEAITGSAVLTVTASSDIVASVEVTPGTFSGNVGDTVQLTAVAKNAGGDILAGKVISWVSDTPSVATVTATGLVTLVAVGSVEITADCEGFDDSSIGTVSAAVVPVSTVTVAPATFSKAVGETQTLTATTKDSLGNTLVGRVVTWESSNASVATVSSTGVVTAVAAGSATITATSEGKFGTSAATITVAPVATVTVLPNPFSVPIGETFQLTATLKDALGNVLTGRVVTWGSSNNLIASVSSTGLVTGLNNGSVTITATSETKAGTSTGTVVASSAIFPVIPVTPPTGLTHSTVTDLFTGEVFATSIDPDYLSGGSVPVTALTDTGNSATNFANLQAAFNAAPRPSVITVPITFESDSALDRLFWPAKAGTDLVYVMPETVYNGTFPRAENERVVAADEAVMPIIRGSNTLGIFATANSANASYLRIIGFRFTTDASDCTAFAVSAGDGDPTVQTTLAGTPRRIIFDRCAVRPAAGSIGGKGGIGLHCREGAVIGCRVSNWKSFVHTDSQGIAGWNGAGPFHIYNNYIEAAGENIMFGGGLDQAASDMFPSDIVIRKNHLFKPLEWNPYSGSFAGTVYNVKNLIEFKGARRVLIEFNCCDHSWLSGQTGQGIVNYSVNQTGNAPWVNDSDYIIRYNDWNDTNSFAHLTARGAAEAVPGKRYYYAHNLVRNMNGPSSGPGVAVGIKLGRDLAGGIIAALDQVYFHHNTIVCDDADRVNIKMIEFENPPLSEGGKPHTNISIKDNILGNSDYMIFSSQGMGNVALAAHCVSPVFQKNVVVEYYPFAASHPADNSYTNLAGVQFEDFAGEDFRLKATSPYKNLASDGQDPGVNMTILNAQIAGVR